MNKETKTAIRIIKNQSKKVREGIINHQDPIITLEEPDFFVMFHSGRTLEVRASKVLFNEHMITIIGTEESFYIPHGSYEFIKAKNKQEIR